MSETVGGNSHQLVLSCSSYSVLHAAALHKRSGCALYLDMQFNERNQASLLFQSWLLIHALFSFLGQGMGCLKLVTQFFYRCSVSIPHQATDRQAVATFLGSLLPFPTTFWWKTFSSYPTQISPSFFLQVLSMVMREKSAVLAPPLPPMRKFRLNEVFSQSPPVWPQLLLKHFPSRPFSILVVHLWMLRTLTGQCWHSWSIMPVTHSKIFAFVEKHRSRPGIWIRMGQSIKKSPGATRTRLSCQNQKWYLLWYKD